SAPRPDGSCRHTRCCSVRRWLSSTAPAAVSGQPGVRFSSVLLLVVRVGKGVRGGRGSVEVAQVTAASISTEAAKAGRKQAERPVDEQVEKLDLVVSVLVVGSSWLDQVRGDKGAEHRQQHDEREAVGEQIEDQVEAEQAEQRGQQIAKSVHV